MILKRIIIVIALLAIGAIGLTTWQLQVPGSPLQQKFQAWRSGLPSLPSLSTLPVPAAEVATPGPLRNQTEKIGQSLTIAGTLAETNRHRAEAGASQLVANAKLNAAAQVKLNDMFTRQYFEHIGPDGKGPSDWVEESRYAYIAVGENLALGSFEGDAALVNAWMASPGHRANLLNPHFIEIGIAVGEGTFEGEKTWLAVQEFGTPMSACPSVSATLNNQFEQKKSLAASLEKELSNTKTALNNLITQHDQLVTQGNAEVEAGNEASRRGDQEAAQQHWDKGEALQNQARELEPQIKEKRDAYNSFVSQYNSLNNELIDLAAQINAQINQYNSCIAKFGTH